MNVVTKRRLTFLSVNLKTFLKFTFYNVGYFYCLQISGVNSEIVPSKSFFFTKKGTFVKNKENVKSRSN